MSQPRWPQPVAVLVLLVLAAGVAAAVFLTPGQAWPKVQLLLGLLSLYGLAVGFLSAAAVDDGFKQTAADLTTYEPLAYVRANFLYVALLSRLIADALQPPTASSTRPALHWLGTVLWVLAALPLAVFVLVHLLVLVPIAYPCWVLASALIISVESGPAQSTLTLGDKPVASVRALFRDVGATRAFLVGVPALLLSNVDSVIAALSPG